MALIGLIGYIVILGTLLAPDREETRLATLALTVIGFGFSAYLTYREGHSIHAYCEECLTSAAFMTLLLLASIYRYVTVSDAPRRPATSPPAAQEEAPDAVRPSDGSLRPPLRPRARAHPARLRFTSWSQELRRAITRSRARRERCRP